MTLRSPIVRTVTGGTVSPAAAAKRSAAHSMAGTSKLSLRLENLANHSTPCSSRTDALGRAPPRPVPSMNIASRCAGIGSPSSMRSAASIRCSSACEPLAPREGPSSMDARMSSAPTRSLPACSRYCDSGKLLAGTLSLASMTRRPHESGAASRMPPKSGRALAGSSRLPITP